MKSRVLEIRTATITSKGQIAIPKEVREAEGFEEGKKVVVIAYADHIEVRPLKLMQNRLTESMVPALLSEKALARDWLSKEEDEAWKDL